MNWVCNIAQLNHFCYQMKEVAEIKEGNKNLNVKCDPKCAKEKCDSSCPKMKHEKCAKDKCLTVCDSACEKRKCKTSCFFSSVKSKIISYWESFTNLFKPSKKIEAVEVKAEAKPEATAELKK